MNSMDNLPIDTSHPAVRDYLTLVRLQALTPLSLLINIATVGICATATKPTIGEVMKDNLMALSPQRSVLAAYIGLLFLGQIGYCLMLVMASKRETKTALVKGVGMSLVTANFIMALWAICWVMRWYLVASVLQGILLLLLLYSNLALYIYHAATSARPLDTAFIHAPIRFFLVLVMMLLFPYCLLVALHLNREPIESAPWHAWASFGIVLGTNLLALLVVVTQRDVVCCVAATWISVSLWSQRPKPVSVLATAIAATAVHPIALIAAMTYTYYMRRFSGQGHVALPRGDDHPGLYGQASARRGHRSVENTSSSAAEEGTAGATSRADDIGAMWG